MYLEFFGLHRHPFRITPEDDFIYMSQQHSRAYVYMSSAIWSSEGFVVISGEIGSGKTTLLKKTIRNLDGNLKLLNISYTNLESRDLFGLILRKAGLNIEDESKVAMLFQITDYLEKMATAGTPVVLTIDEAQNLTPHEVKTILTRAAEGTKVVLMGDPGQVDNSFLNADSNGLVYVSQALIDSEITKTVLEPLMPVHAFAGGSHRFSHMEEALPLIQGFIQDASLRS